MEIRFQIIGLRENKNKYDAYIEQRPATPDQKLFFKFFGLKVPRGLLMEQARETITEHTKAIEKLDATQIKEYNAYKHILEEFCDIGFREINEVKKPSMDVLNNAYGLKEEPILT